MIKRVIFIVIGFVLFSLVTTLSVYASSAEDALGLWWTASKDAKIEIYKKEDKFYGKIVWTNDPDELDINNPDPEKRSNKLWGLDIISNFSWDGDEWVDGEIYDPSSGETYSCIMWMKGKNVLYVKGYIGISILGRKERWTRVKG
ncbi:MAG: DUF2147 domain-containing protein [Proteobacteria bacterium]|nr:DUF2147 domain-containing protein [Pseudomonadota bacterium]